MFLRTAISANLFDRLTRLLKLQKEAWHLHLLICRSVCLCIIGMIQVMLMHLRFVCFTFSFNQIPLLTYQHNRSGTQENHFYGVCSSSSMTLQLKFLHLCKYLQLGGLINKSRIFALCWVFEGQPHRSKVNYAKLLTLGAHAQRGLQ